MQQKAALILSDELNAGLKANIATVLGMSLASANPQLIGESTLTKDNVTFPGITRIPIPVLESDIATIRNIADEAERRECWKACFTDAALSTKNYQDYRTATMNSLSDNLIIYGLVMFGDKKTVNQIVGSLSLVK